MNIRMVCAVAGALVSSVTAMAVAPGTSPAPTACPKRFAEAEPRNQSTWITMEDYPQRALREGRGGRVVYRVNVTVAGRAENVEILESPDSDLAGATMRVLTRRARFTPTIRDCQPVPGEFEGSLTWSAPE